MTEGLNATLLYYSEVIGCRILIQVIVEIVL